MSDGVRMITIVCSVENAVFILLGYYYILYDRMYVKDGSETQTNAWLWAGIGRNSLTRFVSGVSICAAIASFFVLFKGICDGCDWATDVEGFVLPYILFLFFSSLYSLLMLRVFQESENESTCTNFLKMAVLVDLFCVAAAACVMAYSIWKKNPDGWVVAASLVLAFNCTVVDLMFWGSTWFVTPTKGIHHSNKKTTLIFSTAIGCTDFINHLRIGHTDVIRSGQADYSSKTPSKGTATR